MVAVTAQEQLSGLQADRNVRAVQACPLRERLLPRLSPCLPQPMSCAGWGDNLSRRRKMQDQEHLTPKRLPGPKPTFKPYRVPRYRLTLVAESSGVTSSEAI